MWDTKAAVECWSSLLSHCFDCIGLRLEKMKVVSFPSADGNAISAFGFSFNYEVEGIGKYQYISCNIILLLSETFHTDFC